jgi:catalase
MISKDRMLSTVEIPHLLRSGYGLSLFLTLSLWGTILSVSPGFTQNGPDAETVVNTLEKISGVHKGIRRNHAKGTCATGVFQASIEAQKLSSSALFSGKTVTTIARFSLAGPNPAIPDTMKNPRGMALQFQLPGGELHQMAMLNTPVFGAATVQSFFERQQADVPDPTTGKRDSGKLEAYISTHPDNKEQATWLSGHNPPPTFSEAAYYSLNAFKFVDANKKEHWVKWRFEPRDGEKFLGEAEMQSLPHDFLFQRLTERVRKGPVQWDMIVSLGEAGDPLDNPSVAWPKERREVNAGTLTLTRAGTDAEGQCEDINFDPNVLSAGVEPSPDAILAFRSAAYAVSFGRRLEEQGR